MSRKSAPRSSSSFCYFGLRVLFSGSNLCGGCLTISPSSFCSASLLALARTDRMAKSRVVVVRLGFIILFIGIVTDSVVAFAFAFAFGFGPPVIVPSL